MELLTEIIGSLEEKTVFMKKKPEVKQEKEAFIIVYREGAGEGDSAKF